MKKNNIVTLKNFLLNKENGNLIVNKVADEIGIFYEMVISNMANNLDIKIIKELENEKFDNTNDLFEHRKVHIFNIVGTKTIEEILSKDFSKIIITDSGGVQEEAPSLGKPVLVMRDATERPEAVEAGTVLLTGTNENLIVSKALELLTNSEKYKKMSKLHNPYGDGMASKRIVDFLKNLK